MEPERPPTESGAALHGGHLPASPPPASPPGSSPPRSPLHRSRAIRGAWAAVGLLFVVIGGIGVVVPGLPTTGFLILAAWCFSHSSPRLEAWLLGLPKFGPLIRDYRLGLGMPRVAKRWAIGSIVCFSTISCVLLRGSPVRVGLIAAVALVGVGYVAWTVPTREQVLAERAARP